MRQFEGSGEVAEMAARGRKRNFLLEESELSTSSFQRKTHRFAKTASPASSGSSEPAKGSPKFADLKENAVNVEREQMMPRSDGQVESGELESTARPPESNFRRRSTAEKIPTEDELENFFAAAEKNLQKRFIDKYNFDIVKDKPLEGRYEWVPVQLKP
ncbi:hypothetical protein CASFOL_011452 [Castilleja foliolosa]|uniref:Cyclin-dependent kinase inhibitor domain-containing protein n=1 Tax=Castilleja foliolosa TaxID=1961234 RepID=A0ABD3DW46_9LAMI